MDLRPNSNLVLSAMHATAQHCGTQMQAWSRTAEPAMLAAMQWNTEAMAFAKRRAEAYLSAPQRLSACRSPQDAMRETLALWEAASRDWVDTCQRMMAPFAAAASGVRRAADRADGVPAQRDFITFPEPKDARESAPGAPWTGRAEKSKRDAA